MKFIKVIETRYKEEVLVNVEQISHIFIQSSNIVLCGNHWSDIGAWGMLSLDEESMKRVLKEVGYVDRNFSDKVEVK